MTAGKVLRLSDAAERVGRSERTLWRWQTEGLIVIYPGGWVRESHLLAAERLVRVRRSRSFKNRLEGKTVLPDATKQAAWEELRDSFPVCSVEACTNLAWAERFFCSTHLRRFQLFGVADPEDWGRDYRRAHEAVARVRGKATDHRCSHCPRPAAEWAYDHEDPNELRLEVKGGRQVMPYSFDPERYRALCVPCHRKFDTKFRVT